MARAATLTPSPDELGRIEIGPDFLDTAGFEFLMASFGGVPLAGGVVT
jgi:hypothetical protein